MKQFNLLTGDDTFKIRTPYDIGNIDSVVETVLDTCNNLFFLPIGTHYTTYGEFNVIDVKDFHRPQNVVNHGIKLMFLMFQPNNGRNFTIVLVRNIHPLSELYTLRRKPFGLYFER